MSLANATGKCPYCGRPTFGEARHCKARQCVHYAPIWAKDTQVKLFTNTAAYDDGDGAAVMFTVTAPGRHDLPWSDRCDALGDHAHSGLLGCGVVAELAQEWNTTAPERWRRLHDRCARLTARRTGTRPHLLLRGWEMQARGVLHVHAVVARGRGCDKRASDVYGEELVRLAKSYGFGHVDTPTGRARHARESAAYLSAYLTKGKGHKKQLCETVRSHELPRSVFHVSTRLTLRTRCTMRTLRLRRYVHAVWGNVGVESRETAVLFLTGLPGCELQPMAGRAPPRTRNAAVKELLRTRRPEGWCPNEIEYVRGELHRD